MKRRDILKGLGLASALPLVAPAAAWAQGGWPSRTLTMIVPFPPGGQADLAARRSRPRWRRSWGSRSWSKIAAAPGAPWATPPSRAQNRTGTLS